MHTLTEKVTLVTESCCVCDCLFAMPDTLQKRAEQNGEMFYCPNGHGQNYVKTEVQRQRERADRLERILADTDENLRSERAAHKNTKGQLTKAKNQIGRTENGVCPRCKRSFKNLHDHMKTKHGTEADAAKVAQEHAQQG